MALETCFRAWALHAPQAPLGCRDKLHLGNGSHGASKRAVVAPSSTAASPSSPVLSARRVGTMKSRFVCQAKNVVDEVVVADEKNWDNVVIASDMPVLVDFWAPWCGPCRMIDPVISELAKDYAGKIKCCKVNTDDSPNIASNYGIRSIPTVLIFKDGEKKESIIGAVPKSTLCTIIDKYLEN